jgi:hypothetical protein
MGVQWRRFHQTLRAKFGWVIAIIGATKWLADWWGRGEVVREWMQHLPHWLHFLSEPWVVPLTIIVGLGMVFWAALDRGGLVGFDNVRWLPEAYRKQRLPHEYIVGFVVIVVVILVGLLLHKQFAPEKEAVVVLSEQHQTKDIAVWTQGAKLEWGPFTPVSPPNGKTPFFFNVYMPNKGQLDALNVRRAYTWRLTQKKGEELSPADLDKGMSLARAALMYPLSDEVTDRVAAGDSLTWFTVNDEFLTQKDYRNIALGNRRLYLWAILEYRDTESPPERAIFTEFCAYWEGSFAFYHSCDKYNSIHRGPRITALTSSP